MVLLNISVNGFVILFVYCYFGQFATDNYAKFWYHLYNVPWYQLPLPIQKSFVLMTENAEGELVYDGFHLLSLDLRLFGQVV